MSIETPTVQETTPVVNKPVEAISAPTQPMTVPETTTASTGTAGNVQDTMNTPVTQEPAKDEVVVEATPTTEGVLGYKAPGLLKQFRFVKHFFWFSDTPMNQDALDSYLRAEKHEHAHSNAAWAQETGKGVMYYAKRAEDKSAPTGLILLTDAHSVTKSGMNDFSFKVGSHTHRFETSTSDERDSWIVTIEKKIEECKHMKDEITGRDSYKKTISGYAFSPMVAGSSAAAPVKTEAAPKKSLDANTVVATPAAPVAATETTTPNAVAAHESKDAKIAEKQAKKERSQSRKRSSVFGLFGKKDEEKEMKKEEKAEHKAEEKHIKEEKKAEKEQLKEEKKHEAEQKKEEAKAEHNTTKAKEATEAAAVAAAPAAAIAAVEKKEDKKIDDATSPTEKKNKRASVFGGFFGKKVQSPDADRTEPEMGPAVPAKDAAEPHVVSATAPKLEEPLAAKPIDTAAVTAPVDASETAAAPITTMPAETVNEPASTTTADSALSPKSEKKSFLSGLMKKNERKEENAVVAEESHKDIVATPAVPVVAETAPETAVVDTPATTADVAKDERVAREKRRTSLFGSFGTLKRKGSKSPAPMSAASATPSTVNDATTTPEAKEVKREKSPMPSKIGGLFRKPSRAVKSETPAAETTSTVNGTTANNVADAPASDVAGIPLTMTDKIESKIVGDKVPEELHATVHDAVTSAPVAASTEIKTTA